MTLPLVERIGAGYRVGVGAGVIFRTSPPTDFPSLGTTCGELHACSYPQVIPHLWMEWAREYPLL